MILEVAELKVKPDLQAEFLRNVQKGLGIFRRAKGCRAMELRQSPEAPGEFRLLVVWEKSSTRAKPVNALSVSRRAFASSCRNWRIGWTRFIASWFMKPTRSRSFEGDVEHVHYEPGGQSAVDIVQEILICEPELASALVGYLHSAYQREVRDGDVEYYDRFTPQYGMCINRGAVHERDCNGWPRFGQAGLPGTRSQ